MIDKIHMLKGPDRVRKRPAVIFGSDGIEGAQAAVKMLLDIFATEAMLGYCTSISVTHDNGEITVSSDDRGLYLGQDTPDSDEVWKSVFCELYPGPQSGPDEKEYIFSLFDHQHGLLFGDQAAPDAVFLPDSSGTNELCLLQFASKQMDVTVVRDSVRSELSFRCGYPVGGIRHSKTSDKNGTTVCFRLDSDVFSETVLAPTFFVELMQTYAMLVPGLSTHYINSSAGRKASFFFRDGIAEYLRLNAQCPYAPLYTNQIAAAGKERYNRREYQAVVKAALCFVPHGGAQNCYHNLRYLPYGGTHLKEITSLIRHEINFCFQSYIEEKTGRPNAKIQQSEIEEHLYLIVETWCSRFASEWENGTRQSIRNVMIKDMAHDLFRTEFSNYVYKHKAQLQSWIDHILTSRQK